MLNEGKPVTSLSLVRHLEGQGFVFDTRFKVNMFSVYGVKIFNGSVGDHLDVAASMTAGTPIMVSSYVENNDKFFIWPEAYQNYIDYIELQEAHQASKEARMWAILALVVTILTSIASITIQLADTVRFDEQQLKLFMESYFLKG